MRIKGRSFPTDILIFAGTTEGRKLAEYASAKKIPCFVSTATEYGAELISDLEGIRLLSGRMDREEMGRFIRENGIRLVVDATHPFAREVTKNIQDACTTENVRYVRCLRGTSGKEPAGNKSGGKKPGQQNTDEGTGDINRSGRSDTPGVISVSSVEEAVDYLRKTTGNILITTGSKELHLYTAIDNYEERCFARVLSTPEAVVESARLGFKGRHLIAMQGPFSEEMNLALLHMTEARYFVTKESGREGGFETKRTAAEKAGAALIVIARPEEEGKSLDETQSLIYNHASSC